MPVVTLISSNTIIKDTRLIQNAPNNNYGTQDSFFVGYDSGSGTYERALISFDLGLIPNDAIINAATLKLYSWTTGTTSFDVCKVTSSWDELTATWNAQPSSVVATNANGSTANAYKDINIKNLVQEWVNGATNYGIMLKASLESSPANPEIHFASSNDPSASRRPQLIIDYTIPTTGKKQVEYVGSGGIAQGNTNNVTVALPTGIQQGDLLVANIYAGNNVNLSLAGWTIHSLDNSGKAFLAYKYAVASEPAPTFNFSAATPFVGRLSSFRNVKRVVGTPDASFYGSSTTAHQPNSDKLVSVDKTVFALFLSSGMTSSVNFTPPLGYAEAYDFYTNYGSLTSSFRYMHFDRDQKAANEMTTTSSAAIYTGVYLLVLEPNTNSVPTLTLTSPSDNQVLSEGSSYQVSGTATEADNNNVVTIKYKINNGTTYNAGSGVSDGVTPISFAKNLTYSNKRLRDGATDITGVDLAENTNHTLTVWAEDNAGGVSSQVTRTFTVVWNRPPAISGTDTNLGTISTIPTFNYSVTDPEGNTFTIAEYLNGVQTKSFAGVAGQNYSITLNQDTWLRLPLGIPHQVKVRATDNSGQFSERVYTFTRTETKIAFTLKNAFLCDAQPQRVLVTLDSVVPTGATQLIEVCNNAFDVSPTWEDVTSYVTAGRGYIFTNATKTATNWGINIRFTFNKGTATQPIFINGYGGAFD